MTRIFGNSIVFLMLALSGAAVFADGTTLLPRVPTGKGESCVEPTGVMRRDHMKFLLHQRDETVHGGVRGSKHSLVGCIDCHVQRSQGVPVPVNAEGQFCESCHSYAGVRMDCFECHAAVPAAQPAPAALPEWMRSPAVTLNSSDAPVIK